MLDLLGTLGLLGLIGTRRIYLYYTVMNYIYYTYIIYQFMGSKTYRVIHGLKYLRTGTQGKQKHIEQDKTDHRGRSRFEFAKLRDYDLDHIGLSRVRNKTVDKYV
jgi:hypothetical protein